MRKRYGNITGENYKKNLDKWVGELVGINPLPAYLTVKIWGGRVMTPDRGG